ncbi:unnamed protein product [Paramecium octaurelia]|uniref:Uncharacterized protein n=1 Tax=Paramecium octaurelia TaxID=43137 RepID=A0A8S1YA17_PAROT|nr:unnamed protein product [Paramecium octaurelia]CAD8210423.1 unnamed protein product [Paramecium octaurelia]
MADMISKPKQILILLTVVQFKHYQTMIITWDLTYLQETQLIKNILFYSQLRINLTKLIKLGRLAVLPKKLEQIIEAEDNIDALFVKLFSLAQERFQCKEDYSNSHLKSPTFSLQNAGSIRIKRNKNEFYNNL